VRKNCDVPEGKFGLQTVVKLKYTSRNNTHQRQGQGNILHRTLKTEFMVSKELK